MNGPLHEQTGPLGYFEHFFTEAHFPSRVILLGYFIVFLITPLYGLPESQEQVKFISGSIVTILATVQVLALIALAIYNRRHAHSQFQVTGRYIFLTILIIFLLFMFSFTITLFIGNVPFWVLRVTTSIAMTIPLLLVVLVLVQSIIFMGRTKRIPRLPILLAFVMIFLLIYSFGTFYFINGLIIRADGMQVSFADSLYVSGLAFTSLGFYDAFPIGVGKVLAILESVSGYITIALITTIFLQMVFGQRNSE
jgi:hypothetical protein